MNRFSSGSPGVNGDVTGVAKTVFFIENGRDSRCSQRNDVFGESDRDVDECQSDFLRAHK